MKKILYSLFLSFFMLLICPVYASHIEGGNLTFVCIGPHQYQLTLTLYRDCHGIQMPSSVIVDYSSVQCGVTDSTVLSLPANFVPIDVTDTCPGSKSYCDGGTGFGVQKYTYTNIINLPAGCGSDWIMSYQNCCRNTAITTINNPGAAGIYIQATLNNTLSQCDDSPQFLDEPVAFVCLNQLDLVNQGGYDANGDSLVYSLIPSQIDAMTNVTYLPGYSAATPLSVTGTFGFNTATGQLSFTPNQTEVGIIKILVQEYRGGVLIGSVERDLQIVVQQCSDTLPSLSNAVGPPVVSSTTAEIGACSSGCFTISTSTGATSTRDTLTMSVTGLANTPGATFTITPGRLPSAVFCWSPTRANAGTHNIYVTVKDNACPNPGQVTKTYTIIVPEIYPAGPDQTICQYNTVNAEGTSTTSGRWTAMTTNPVTTTIATPTSPTTLITGFSTAGRYNYIWISDTTCVDTMSIFVTAKPNAGPDQAVCQYGVATMAATGTGTWRAVSSNPTMTIITDSIVATTTISGFSTLGTYSFIWTSNSCTDTVNVIVSPKPNAGPDQSICSSTGTATMAATGTGTWSASASNPNTTVITNPSSPTTTISGLTSGTYAYYWSLGCEDTVLISVINQANGGPNQTICQYNTVRMGAVGTGTWSAIAGNPATTTIVNPGSDSTIITGFTAAGRYYFLWSIGTGCVDTVIVNVTAKPNAGTDQTICQYSTTMMAGTGTGIWTALSTNPITTVIVTPASAATEITGFTVAGTYSYVWTSNGCTDTANVTVTAKPNAGPDQVICQYNTTTLAATGPGLWTAAPGNPAVVIFTNNILATTTASGFTSSGAYTLIWTTNGCSDSVIINVTAKPNAGPDETICQYNTTMMAGTGTGIWTALSTNPITTVIVTPASATTEITGFSVAGTYSYVWTSNGCTDTASVTVTAKPNAGPDQVICQYNTTTLAATGPGLWTVAPGNPAVVIFTNNILATTTASGFTSSGAYTLIWTTNGCSDSVIINVTAKPNAGPDETICQYNTVMMAGSGAGIWTAFSTNPITTVIVTPVSATTEITGFSVAGTYSYVWTSNGCTDTASVIVTAKPNAGTDQVICQYNTTTLAATGTGTWSAAAGNPAVVIFTNNISSTTTASGFTSSGAYTLIWTNNGCSDSVIINVTAKPNAGPDETICQYNTAMMAGTGTGIWTAMSTNPIPTVIVMPTSAATEITGFTVAGTYSYVWTSNGCTDTASVIVTAKPNAGPDELFCLPGSAVLYATGGPGVWSALASNPATNIVSPHSDTTAVTGITTGGYYSYIFTVNGCTDTMVVTAVPTDPAGPDQTICQYNPIVTAGFGPGTWVALSNNPNPTVIADSAADTTAIRGFIVPGVYGFIWEVSPCTDTLYVTVIAKPNAGLAQSICQYSPATLSASGAGMWTALSTNPTATVIVTPASPATEVRGLSVAGVYSYIWTVNGCSDTTTVTVTAKPNAGADQSLCQYSATSLTATGAGIWTADAGNPAAITFTNPNDSTTQVSGFTAPGTYTLYWSLNGCSDTVLINVTPKPDAGSDQSICLPGSITMAASAGPGLWTALAGNPAPTTIVSPSSPSTLITGFTTGGTYSYIWTVNGCADTMSVYIVPLTPAGPDQTTCQYSTVTTAAFGSGTWTILSSNPAVTTLANPSSDTTAINGFTTAGIYGYVWTVNGCTDTMYVTVVAKPNAGPDQTICQNATGLMTATGTGTWTADAGNPAIVTFINATDPTTLLSGFTAPGIYTLYWSLNGCSDTVLINVTSKPNGGPGQTICQYSTTTLAATGSGMWTADSDNPATVIFANDTSATTSVSGFTLPGAYLLYWTLNGCSDFVIINVTGKPDAGSDQVICQYSTTDMTATGMGTWTADAGNPAVVTIVNTTDSITSISGFIASGVYTLYWSLSGCSDTVLINVTAKPNAGTDQTICQYSTTVLDATGTGTWTADAGNPAVISFSNNISPTSSVSGFITSGTYTLYWSANGCTDTVLINVTAKPNAGADQTICQNTTATMSATGTGTWTAAAGNPAIVNFTNTSDPATTVTGFIDSGTYMLYWTLGGCSDTVNIYVSDSSKLSVSNGAVCLGQNDTLTAVISVPGGTFSWSPGGAATQSIIVSPAATSTYTVIYTIAVCGTYTASATVTIYPTLTLTSQHDTICEGSSAALTTTPSTTGGTYLWSPGGFTTPGITVTPATDAVFTVTYTLAGCPVTSVSDTVDVTVPPTVALAPATVCLGDSTVLTAVPSQAGGTYLWSPGGQATQSITVTPATTSTYTVFYAIPLSVCPPTTQTATVTVTPQPTLTVSDTAVCLGHDGTLTATPSVPGGIYIWSPGGNTTASITVSPAATSIYSVTYSIAGCGSVTHAGTITVNPNPVVTALTAQPITCFGYTNGTITPSLTPATGTYTYLWSNAETSDIDTGLAAGSYNVVVTDHNGCTATAATAGIIPAAPVDGMAEIMPGDITVLQDSMIQLTTTFSYPASAITGYSWTPTTGLSCTDCADPMANTTNATDSIVSYTVTIIYNNGCSANAVNTIHILSGVAIADAFTPNGDGKNDIFTIMARGVNTYHMTIYNRWGELVFESYDLATGWDGTYKGSAQPSGVYVYFVAITYYNGQSIAKTGNVTLLR